MNKKNISLWLFAIVAIVVGAAGVIKAYSGSSPKVVVEGDYIESGEQASNPDEIDFSGLIEYRTPVLKEGLTFNEVNEDWVVIEIPKGNVTAAYTGGLCNYDSVEWTVDYAEFRFLDSSDQASTTFMFDLTTSTPDFFAYNANPESWLIDSVVVPTSTPFASSLLNTIENGGTKGKSAMRVLAGDCLSYLISQSQDIGADCTGAVCENATSTNRGWEGIIKAHITKIP